ncbi:amino acid ABC transporter permease [Halothermothrix orenii]|uniref:Polar amino acid ABC transporter, inner membrane subunit n=1 Tax=Halothermothrix orenii (strain H 168 / OCM 544 / DSM 9562) TaxID=373903 RepID=B8CZA6_HALOH|nr:amino acid ABC transporter permease [Halothermothrix orenii]ACL70625.1 polar amino acid ABC transporter, inner membrane subunit [Halothermothrix orenii H 168]
MKGSLLPLLEGTLVTIELTILSLILGLIVAVPLAFGQIYGNFAIKFLVSIYERVVRSIPLIVILFLVHYGLPRVGIRLTFFVASVVGLGLRSAAYQSQIFRGAIQSIDNGQMKAALSLGMSKLQAFVTVILPQAIRLIIGPWTNEFTIVLKDSSLAYALGVVELLRQGRYIISTSNKPMPVFLTVAAIYFILTIIVNSIFRYTERKLSIPGLGIEE